MPSAYNAMAGDKRIYGRPQRRRLDPLRRASRGSAEKTSQDDDATRIKGREREEAHVWKHYVMVHAPQPCLSDEDIQRGQEHIQVQILVRDDSAKETTAAAPASAPDVDTFSIASTVKSTKGTTRLGTALISAEFTLAELRGTVGRLYAKKAPIEFFFAVKVKKSVAAPTEAPAPKGPEDPDDKPTTPLYVEELHTLPFEEEADTKVADVADEIPHPEGDAAPLVRRFRMCLVIPSEDALSRTDASIREHFG